MFHSLVVGKDETDNLLQVFNIGRFQVAQKLCIQREFKHVVCQCFGGSAMCSSPNSAGLRWLNVLGRQGASGSVLSCQAWRECERRATLCQKTVVKYVSSFSMCPRNSAAWSYKEPFHPPHQQRADFRDIVKHRFNFRIRIAPTDFWDNCSLKNKQIWNGAAEERQGEEHSAGLKESAASLQCVSYVWNFKYHLLFDGLSVLSVFSLFWKCVPNSCIICLLHHLTKHKEVGRSLSSRGKTLHEKMTQFLFSFTFLFREAQDGTKSLHKCK